MKERRVILLNGCPGSGKDEIAQYLVRTKGFKTLAFKDQAYKSVYTYYNISEDQYMSVYNDREQKDQPQEFLGGLSPRKAMQYVVEQVNKPKLGRDYLARATLDQILKDSDNDYVVSDLGLDEEEIITHYLLQKENYKILEVQRDGCTYTNDTRSRRLIIDGVILNDGTLEELYNKVDKLI